MTTTMDLPKGTWTCQQESVKNEQASESFNHTSFVDDMSPEDPVSMAANATDKILQLLAGNNLEKDFSAMLADGNCLGNTNSEDSLSIWPTPISSSRIHVVGSLPLKDSIKKAPVENSDTLYELLGQLFRGHHDTPPYSQSTSYCAEVKAPQDYIAPPATISLSTSACWSSLNSPTSSSKRSMTEVFPHQNKRHKIAPMENFGVDTTDQGSEPPGSRSLESIPFKPQQSCQWLENFKALCEFRENHGHCNVPPKFNTDRSLWRWIKRQRYQYKLKQEGRKSKAISDDRIAALERIGFVWDSQGTLWMEHLTNWRHIVVSTDIAMYLHSIQQIRSCLPGSNANGGNSSYTAKIVASRI